MNEFIPFFAVYDLLFAERGLSYPQNSALLIGWSLTSIVVEIPSGAWADTFSRKRLLMLAAVMYAGCFAVWTLWQTAAGFAAGFVLWGISGALSSGTFQALAYDELVAIDARDAYPRVIGWGSSLALAAVTAAVLSAAPLMVLGGFAAVGWVSVVIALLQLLVVATLPQTPRVVSATDTAATGTATGTAVGAAGGTAVDAAGAAAKTPTGGARSGDSGAFEAWWTTLRQGLSVCRRDVVLRGGVLACGLLMGLLAFDEYFGLVLREHGYPLAVIPLALGVITAAQAVGGLVAERFVLVSPRTLAVVAAVAAATLAVGLLTPGWAAVGCVAAGYGTLTLLIVVAEVRLQDAAPTAVRATVTSVSNVLAELLAIGVYLVVAGVSPVAGLVVAVAALAAAVVLSAPLLRRWLPQPAR